MRRKHYIAVITALTITGAMAFGQAAFASTDHYNDSSKTGTQEEWSAWQDRWEETAADFTKVSITPGADETQLNFAWYSENTGSEATPVVHFGTDQTNLETFTGESGAVNTDLTGGTAYDYNHVTVTGLTPDTTYYYTVEKNGEQTEAVEYKTGSLDTVKILYVGDPQIGASKGQPQGDGELVNDDGAANTAAENDGFAWNRTLQTAAQQNADLNFVISAGDEVRDETEVSRRKRSMQLIFDFRGSLRSCSCNYDRKP